MKLPEAQDIVDVIRLVLGIAIAIWTIRWGLSFPVQEQEPLGDLIMFALVGAFLATWLLKLLFWHFPLWLWRKYKRNDATQ
jgi:hypothetical protein